MNELRGSGTNTLYILYVPLLSALWSVQDEPPLDVSGHPVSVVNISWCIVSPSVLCAKCTTNRVRSVRQTSTADDHLAEDLAEEKSHEIQKEQAAECASQLML